MQPPDNLKRSETPSEVDSRFPSGPWVGFWIQRSFGKQKMSLYLSFREGRVSGAGSDIIGRFTMQGTYDLNTGRCLLTKQYELAHRLEYDGANQGDELWLWGIWQLPGDRGGFHLWPKGQDDPTQRRSKATKRAPHGTTRRLSLIPTCAP
jgi:hypothetical protein